MKPLLLLIVFLGATGCTTLKPVQMSPEQLQDRISAGDVLEVGDSVKIVTTDGSVHKFRVTAVTADQIAGQGIEIPVDEIIAVETREFSGGKTTALAAGSVAIAYVVAAAVATATLLAF